MANFIYLLMFEDGSFTQAIDIDETDYDMCRDGSLVIIRYKDGAYEEWYNDVWGIIKTTGE